MTTTEPTAVELVATMDALDRARNLYGPLRPASRARVAALVEQPTRDTWEDARGLILTASGGCTVWQACLRFTDYGGTTGGDAPPTRAQLVAALTAATQRNADALAAAVDVAEARHAAADLRVLRLRDELAAALDERGTARAEYTAAVDVYRATFHD